MRLAVKGVGCLGSYGLGSAFLWEALQHGTPLPIPAPKTQTECLKNIFQPRMLRQMDHFSRMALLGGWLALNETSNVLHQDIGIIVATGFGPATPTFSFLQSLLEFGEGMASPLAFSHSVHNIPAATLAIKLGIQGPCATLCQPVGVVVAGLSLAHAWIAEARVQHVLLIAADELPSEMNCALTNSAFLQPDEEFLTTQRAEGCAAFILAADTADADMACVQWHCTASSKYHAQAETAIVTGSSLPAPPGIQRSFQGETTYGRIPVSLALGMAAALSAPHSTLCMDMQHSPFHSCLYTHVFIQPGA